MQPSNSTSIRERMARMAVPTSAMGPQGRAAPQLFSSRPNLARLRCWSVGTYLISWMTRKFEGPAVVSSSPVT